MIQLYFSDLLKCAGIDPKRVKLLRYAYSDKTFNACASKGMVYNILAILRKDT